MFKEVRQRRLVRCKGQSQDVFRWDYGEFRLPIASASARAGSVVNAGTVTVVRGAGESCGAFTGWGAGGAGGVGRSKVAVVQ